MESGHDVVRVPTARLGGLAGVSQQTAARYLKELEDDGLIRRIKTGRGQGIVLTEKGVSELSDLYSSLRSFFEGAGPEAKVTGTLSKGMGEGAYYVGEYAAEMEGRLSYKPYPGTFNVKTGDVPGLDRFLTGTINGFRKRNRTFGSIRYAPVKVSANGRAEVGHLIVPARTHHRGILEIVSPVNLREALGVCDGDSVDVEFVME